MVRAHLLRVIRKGDVSDDELETLKRIVGEDSDDEDEDSDEDEDEDEHGGGGENGAGNKEGDDDSDEDSDDDSDGEGGDFVLVSPKGGQHFAFVEGKKDAGNKRHRDRDVDEDERDEEEVDRSLMEDETERDTPVEDDRNAGRDVPSRCVISAFR